MVEFPASGGKAPLLMLPDGTEPTPLPLTAARGNRPLVELPASGGKALLLKLPDGTEKLPSVEFPSDAGSVGESLGRRQATVVIA